MSRPAISRPRASCTVTRFTPACLATCSRSDNSDPMTSQTTGPIDPPRSDSASMIRSRASYIDALASSVDERLPSTRSINEDDTAYRSRSWARSKIAWNASAAASSLSVTIPSSAHRSTRPIRRLRNTPAYGVSSMTMSSLICCCARAIQHLQS